MKSGDVVIVPLPQADGRIKNRPAIVLRRMPPFGDVLVCGVSTQIAHAVRDFDEIIGPSESDFVSSGLTQKSLIRLGFLTVLPLSGIAGSIGSISSIRCQRLLRKLSDYLVAQS